jgi:hypothetical protein
MGDHSTAVEALEVAIRTDETARGKLEQVVSLKKLRGEDVAEERAEIAELNREIADSRDLLTELQAAGSVVSAPSVAEIRLVASLEKQIRECAIEDAKTQAAIDLIRQGVAAAGQLRDKVKT